MHPKQVSRENFDLRSTTHSAPTVNTELFTQLFEADKKRLYSYIFAFVLDKAAADDIFQETCLTLWQKFDTFEPGTNFSKWANTIAFYRIHRFRDKQSKYQLGLDDDFVNEFSQTIAAIENQSSAKEKKWCHIDHCRSLLSSSLQMVYQRFYVDNLTAQNIATNTGRSIYAIRKAVCKLRKKLIDCVDKKVNEV